MSETTFGLNRIEQISLTVSDVERAVEFYRIRLGMKHLFTSNGLAFFDCAGVRLLLSRAEGPDEPAKNANPTSVIYFKVADIHQAYQTLLSRGVTFADAPHLIADMGAYELWMAFFYDSEKNLLAISGDIFK
jgi:predicted enzyme related to lactoylglutathione lyase